MKTWNLKHEILTEISVKWNTKITNTKSKIKIYKLYSNNKRNQQKHISNWLKLQLNFKLKLKYKNYKVIKSYSPTMSHDIQNIKN